jgi:hypothetical protein
MVQRAVIAFASIQFPLGSSFVAMIFRAPAALTFRQRADALVRAELGRLEQHLTVATARARQAGFLRIGAQQSL